MIRHQKFLAVLMMIAGGLTTPEGRAQVLYGSVVGVLTDPSGAAVPNAAVRLTDQATGLVREGTSDGEGRYSLISLPPGTYDLAVRATAFRPTTRTGIVVVASAVSRLDLTLELGQVTEGVTVSAEASALQTEKSDVHLDLNPKALTNLPLANYRNYQSLINLAPGATPAAFQNAVMDTPQRSLTTNLNGTNRNFNTTRVDGAANIFVSLPHHVAYVPPVETIETVNVTTSSFDAEQGMSGGGAVTIVTKSGTNQLHGVAFMYFDNQELRARNFFLTRPKPATSTKIPGGTIGGPIVKNKLFYFAAWEGFHERSGRVANLSVPTADQRRGDFSQLPVTLYDFTTGAANGTGRQPFPGNVIPAARQSAVAQRIINLVPLPNLPGTLTNYSTAGTQRLDRNNFDGKLSWNRNSNHSLWGKYSRMGALVQCDYALGPAGGPGLCSDGVGRGDTKVHLATVGHTWALRPTLLLDGAFGMTRLDTLGTTSDFGTNFGTDVWGIPGTNVGPTPGDQRYSGMPIIRTDFGDWGNIYTWMPMYRADRSYTFSTNLSKISGAHEFRTGFDMINLHLNTWQPNIGGGPRGLITFGGGVTGLNGGAAPNFLNSFATLVLGQQYSASKSIQNYLQTAREWQYGMYVRDRWQVSRKLTVNLGLRYEYYPLMKRVDRGLERWDPATNKVYLGGVNNTPANAGITVSKTLFAPRVGIAYRLGDKTVIRTGYGINIDPASFARPLRAIYPSVVESTFNGVNTFSPFRSLELGIPPIPAPNIAAGVLDLPSTVSMGPRSPWGGELTRGYIQSWNFTLERRLPLDLVGSVAYVGTQSTHMLADRDINAAAPGAGQLGRPLNQTIGRPVESLMWDGWLSANYHSMQVTLNRQFKSGLMIKGAYTYSKAINMTDDAAWAAVNWNWAPVIHRNRAAASYDRTHMFVLGAVYELPFGAGKPFATGRWGSRILGGWQTNALFSAYTGTPFTVTASGTSLNAPGNLQTADQVNAEVRKIGNIGAGQSFYDPLAFRAVTDVRFGSTGRNILRGPGMGNFDLSLFRTFMLTERWRLEFKAESFNFTNTPHFLNPAANVSNMSLNPDGSVRSLGNFLSVTSALNDERQFRFGLRLSF
jgi:outer membrane receptor protein involved in Fe transport